MRLGPSRPSENKLNEDPGGLAALELERKKKQDALMEMFQQARRNLSDLNHARGFPDVPTRRSPSEDDAWSSNAHSEEHYSGQSNAREEHNSDAVSTCSIGASEWMASNASDVSVPFNEHIQQSLLEGKPIAYQRVYYRYPDGTTDDPESFQQKFSQPSNKIQSKHNHSNRRFEKLVEDDSPVPRSTSSHDSIADEIVSCLSSRSDDGGRNTDFTPTEAYVIEKTKPPTININPHTTPKAASRLISPRNKTNNNNKIETTPVARRPSNTTNKSAPEIDDTSKPRNETPRRRPSPSLQFQPQPHTPRSSITTSSPRSASHVKAPKPPPPPPPTPPKPVENLNNSQSSLNKSTPTINTTRHPSPGRSSSPPIVPKVHLHLRRHSYDGSSPSVLHTPRSQTPPKKVSPRDPNAPDPFDILYRRGMQHHILKEQLTVAASQKKKESEEQLVENICTFKPKINPGPSAGTGAPTQDVFNRLGKSDPKRRATELAKAQETHDKQQVVGCTFKPSITNVAQTIQVEQGKVVDRLVQDAEKRKKDLEKKSNNNKDTKRITKEAEESLVTRMWKDSVYREKKRLEEIEREKQKALEKSNALHNKKDPQKVTKTIQRLYENKDKQRVMAQLEKRASELFNEDHTFRPKLQSEKSRSHSAGASRYSGFSPLTDMVADYSFD